MRQKAGALRQSVETMVLLTGGERAAGHVEIGDVRGAALVSYLLFEQAYTRELIDLGRADTLARRAEVCRFFGWNDPGTALPPSANDSDGFI